MEIVITGRHTSVSERLHRFIEQRLDRLERFFEGLHDARVVIDDEGVSKLVEVTIGGSRGQSFAARGEADTVRAAVTAAESRIETQIRRQRDRLRSRRMRRQRSAD